MIYKAIILLFIVLIIIITIYNSTPLYIQEHIGNMSDMGIVSNFKDPRLFDPVIHHKYESYYLGDIKYGSAYELKNNINKPVEHDPSFGELIEKSSKEKRIFKLELLEKDIDKDEKALDILKKYPYPKVVTIVMKLTNDDPSATLRIIEETNGILVNNKDVIENYFKDKFRQKKGYYDDKEIKVMTDNDYSILLESIKKRKQNIEDYRKNNDLYIDTIETTTTSSNVYDPNVVV